jgi:deoxyinosine 3'endonuclease (endonuclease V)
VYLASSRASHDLVNGTEATKQIKCSISVMTGLVLDKPVIHVAKSALGLTAALKAAI